MLSLDLHSHHPVQLNNNPYFATLESCDSLQVQLILAYFYFHVH